MIKIQVTEREWSFIGLLHESIVPPVITSAVRPAISDIKCVVVFFKRIVDLFRYIIIKICVLWNILFWSHCEDFGDLYIPRFDEFMTQVGDFPTEVQNDDSFVWDFSSPFWNVVFHVTVEVPENLLLRWHYKFPGRLRFLSFMVCSRY